MYGSECLNAKIT